MKIIFLCGSLELGRDGVGDYTRRLAIEMMKQGFKVAAIALKDWHLTKEFNGVQHSEDIDLQVFRLPSILSTKDRFRYAKKYIDQFDPDWISLQFVNFAFDLKGLHFGLGRNLAAIGKGRKWHIMFHELWVGMSVEAKMKHVLWGKVQQYLIKGLILKLKPLVIHTQSRLYKIQLVRLGFKTEYLPLFSNIPVVYKNFKQKNEHSFLPESRNNISFIIFGTIHPLSPVDNFTKEAADYAKKNGIEISAVFIGRNGMELDRWVNAMEKQGFRIELLGEQSPDNISKALSNSSIGISTSSIAYIEKSGSVMAMMEHGLPVICVAKERQLLDMQYVAPPYGILGYEVGNLESCLNMHFDLPETDTISKVVNLMEEAFNKFN